MKKTTILLVSALTILVGCKPFDPTILNAGGEPFSPKLPAMEKQIENNYVFIITPGGEFTGPNPQDVSVLFDREISDKMTNPYTDKKGILLLKINTIRHKVNGGFCLATVFPLYYLPILFNASYGVNKTNIEVQIDVLNANRKLIGSYRGQAIQKTKARLYNNNIKSGDFSRQTYIVALKEALQQAKKNMVPDLDRLNKELN
jgi:hypothetical protein